MADAQKQTARRANGKRFDVVRPGGSVGSRGAVGRDPEHVRNSFVQLGCGFFDSVQIAVSPCVIDHGDGQDSKVVRHGFQRDTLPNNWRNCRSGCEMKGRNPLNGSNLFHVSRSGKWVAFGFPYRFRCSCRRFRRAGERSQAGTENPTPPAANRESTMIVGKVNWAGVQSPDGGCLSGVAGGNARRFV